MPALVAGIHVFLDGVGCQSDVDSRDKPGHDELYGAVCLLIARWR